MNVLPIAADSLGVRSMATLVTAGQTRILIDPGVTVAERRFHLPPSPVERQAQAAAAATDRGGSGACRCHICDELRARSLQPPRRRGDQRANLLQDTGHCRGASGLTATLPHSGGERSPSGAARGTARGHRGGRGHQPDPSGRGANPHHSPPRPDVPLRLRAGMAARSRSAAGPDPTAPRHALYQWRAGPSGRRDFGRQRTGGDQPGAALPSDGPGYRTRPRHRRQDHPRPPGGPATPVSVIGYREAFATGRVCTVAELQGRPDNLLEAHRATLHPARTAGKRAALAGHR